MAGFLPEIALLSPKTMYSPYREGERKSISAPNSAKPTISSSPTLEGSITSAPMAPRRHGHSPKPSLTLKTSKLPLSMAKTTPPLAGSATPVPGCSPGLDSSSSRSQAPSTSSPALGRAGSIRPRTPLRFFKHGGGSTERADPKPKRNKLVKKASILQPTFVMVDPSTAKAERAAMEAEAAQLGLQMADAVAALESPMGVELRGEDGTQVAKASTDADDGTEVNEEDSKHTKRWSRAPLLPNFDFSSTSSNSNHLFDPVPDERVDRDSGQLRQSAETTRVVADIRQAASKTHVATDASEHTYRCSIHAPNNACHLEVERACCEIVTEAGGRILDSFSFPGGLLLWIPPEVPEPITSCELPARGVRIELEKWTEFALPKFDGLRLNPPSLRFNNEWLVAHSEVTRHEVTDSVRIESKAEERVQTWNNALPASHKRKQSQSTIKKHMVGMSPTGGKIATQESNRCLPTNREKAISLVGSLETIRRCGHEESGSIENMSITPRSARDLHGNSEHRFTVVLDVPDSDDESNSEEWESVRSELDG